MSRLRLHYAPDNASLPVRLALGELGVPYETVLVDRAARAQKSPAYLAVNPAGRIPALETPDGPVFETAAILLHLADRHGALAPAPDAAARGGFLSRLFFVSNTLHAELRMIFYAETYAGPGAGDTLKATVRRSLAAHFAMLDREAASGHGWLGAETPSILDLYLAPCLRWVRLYPADDPPWFDLAAYPALAALARRIEARPVARQVATAEGLGPFPFSDPVPATPPEGSAV